MRTTKEAQPVEGPEGGGVGISCRRLSKTFGDIHAVRDLTFEVPMGAVTGFVGANGAGKTTTMRMLLGLIEPTSGTALIGGRRLRDYPNPRRIVGVTLDTPGAHPGHTARAHLGILAAASGIPLERIDEVLELVELQHAAGRRTGNFSLGMKQRLSLAAALLGDPRILMLDEPTKGLDPPGMMWLRDFLRKLADEGRCVFLSSHHLAELDAIADAVVVLQRGRLVAQGQLKDLLNQRARTVVTRSPREDELAAAIREAGGRVTVLPDGGLRVDGLDEAQVGDIAAAAGLAVHHLAEEQVELEDVFLELTGSATETAVVEEAMQ
ncbi:ABC transporter ATP-binding protein [Streptomyces soliscabiei]|uniref:ABC transporter ATP-binding protein n=1 Tax=Streptomyces soliscabiei TaxID=588897 RepID=UPI0029A0F97E|nr:ATP-binding cassette domain-containing protein [Streptomyces sp. NY05-11A]MDX2679237.1 ATP-binding cassette domain-containing protein [Streptomyces sp. NY05-11A]